MSGRRLRDVVLPTMAGNGHSRPSASPVHDAATAPVVWYRRPVVQQRWRLVTRLAEMSPAEVVHRGWRIAAKRVSRIRIRVAGAEECTPGQGEMVSVQTGQGFFAPNERVHLAATMKTQLPEAVERTIREADALLDEGIVLLGCRFRPLAPDFDWLADPNHGRLWPTTVLDDADAVRRVAADVKYVWEVNRHQFLVTLARAYLYGGDERHASACVAVVRRWIASNPPGMGVNWASNLEVAVRSLSWVWALHFLLGTPVLGDDDLRAWLASLRQHRDHLARHLSIYTDPTNHLIGESTALAVLSIWLPEWPESARLRDLALGVLERELARQVAPDGVDREQATSYQRFVLDFALQALAIARRNGVESATISRCARAMLDACEVLVGSSGRAPRIGDGDDARGLPFFTAEPWDFEQVIATGRALVGGGPIRRREESALWLTGDASALDARDAGTPRTRSELLAHGGYAVLRSRTHPAEDRLLFDVGPLGYPPHASHGHADILAVLVDVGGEELLVDPGTFAYYDPAGRRDVFRSTRAHNTVEVGGRDQADAFDPFKWLNLPRVGLEACRFEKDVDYVEAWHDGYQRLRPAARHRRAVIGLVGGWIVLDWLEGRGWHHLSRWFHAPPGARLEQSDGSTVRMVSPSGRNALILQDVPTGDGDTRIEPGTAPYSERYGSLTDAPVVCFADAATLPALRVTAVVPDRASGRIDVVGRAATPDALSIELRDAAGMRVMLELGIVRPRVTITSAEGTRAL